MDTQQYIYLYDLPKKDVSSIKIAQAFKEKAGVTLADSQKPQIKKDLTKPFYTAMVNIKDPDSFKQACEKMRYFDIEGMPCRALPFDRQLLGSNKEKLISQNIFVRAPKTMLHEDLHKLFEQYGPIKSLKASLNPDYTSRGYGFICFENPESAQRAIDATNELKAQEVEVIRFEPKDNKANMRKLMNNIYVKNIPHDWTPENTRKLFEPYGNIKSLVLKSNDIGQFGFVCYDDPGNTDKEYGPKCAAEAIEKLNNMKIGEGEKAPKLVVRHALKGAERAAEKIRETIRYKTSKKRCNLYVKNFPNTYTKEDLMKLFSQFGEIENIRLEKGQTGNAFAFVCFKEPTDAAKAKTNLHNYAVDGKQLVICYYEIKELRQLQNEEAKDKADWEKYQAQQTGGFQWNELTQLPNLTQILTTLMQVIHMHEAKNATTNTQDRMGGGYRRHDGQRQHGNRPDGGYRNDRGGDRRGYQQNQMGVPPQQQPGMGGQGGMPQVPGQMPMPNQMQQKFPNQGMPNQRMPAPMGGNQGMPQMPQSNQMGNQGQGGLAQRYMMQAQRLLPAVQENNPHLQEQVGQCIFDYILQMVGSEHAPKITGMLIDLPHHQIKQYLSSFQALEMKVQEAKDHLNKISENQ